MFSKPNILTTIIIVFLSLHLNSQVVYEHISNAGIYEFLEELANDGIIELNTTVKPWSRTFIADKLMEAKTREYQLNGRQLHDLEFYMNSYTLELKSWPQTHPDMDIFRKNRRLATSLNPLALLYKDSVFTASLKPIWGIQYWANDNGNINHMWGGAEMYGYIGKNVGFYGSLRDNNESEWLEKPDYFTLRQGVPAKNFGIEGVDYSEARGGIYFSWKWGNIGIAKDHFIWGNNYHGANIFSGRQPSFGQIQLNLYPARWFEFHYVHGWLVSEVVDSARSYWDGDIYRVVYHNKYLAANIFSFTPIRRLNISLGNSIIYSDIGVQAAYLVPFLFYKSVDHTLNSTNKNGQNGQNSQMFFDISSRNLKHLHVYVTLFVDEFKMDRVRNPNEHNFLSWKVGGRVSDFPVQNLSLTAEYTRTNPGTYEHNISTTTFESNKYNLGHYMRSNSEEYYLSLAWKPIRGLKVEGSWVLARHGNDYGYGKGQTNDPQNQPVLKDITWDNHTYRLSARYEFIDNAYVFVHLILSDIQGYDVDNQTPQYYLDKFSPAFFQGKHTTVSFGFNVGF
ncbi:MAG: capsule assembly Wzi family protein [Bacteroidetes bacterium]|nr:capsule assembly Wzi family protein [Bacteroidota bacterium]